jgi:hypothetical protein
MTFLIHCFHDGTLEEMGLDISEKMSESILDVAEAEAFHGAIGQSPDREIGPVEGAVMELAAELVTQRNATCRNNPLLWWVGILVQSSLQTGADDYISRGRFNVNILPMDQDIRARLEALLHYSKVLVLDYTMTTWTASRPRLMEVRGDMAAIDLDWINADDDQRPKANAYRHDCKSEAWKDILKHLQRQCNLYLGKEQGTVVGQLRLLVEENC